MAAAFHSSGISSSSRVFSKVFPNFMLYAHAFDAPVAVIQKDMQGVGDGTTWEGDKALEWVK